MRPMRPRGDAGSGDAGYGAYAFWRWRGGLGGLCGKSHGEMDSVLPFRKALDVKTEPFWQFRVENALKRALSS